MKSMFNSCPNCKSEAITTLNGHKYVCGDCDFEYYHNAAASVMVILQDKTEVLLVKRNVNPGKGLLDLPGGFVDHKESATQTVIREIKEELNLDLTEQELSFFGSYPNQYLYKNILYHTLDICFITNIEKNRINTFDKQEIQEVTWYKKEEIRLEDFAFQSTKQVIKDFFK